MHPFKMEHSRAAYRADFVLYGTASLVLLGLLTLAAPARHRIVLCAWVVAGLVAWTLVEYLLHRFVLHGLRPFSDWHADHHRRPAALISAPTLLSAPLFAALVSVPAWELAGPWPACALTFGVLAGYLLYALTHHATHHLRGSRNAWLQRRKRQHALHHGSLRLVGHYGVTSSFWDHFFGSQHRPSTPEARTLARRQALSVHGAGGARMPALSAPIRIAAAGTEVRGAAGLLNMMCRVGRATLGRRNTVVDLSSFEQVDSARLGLHEFRHSASIPLGDDDPRQPRY